MLVTRNYFTMIDELIPGMLSIVGRVWAYFFIEIMFNIIGAIVGRIVIKAVTFGKYPDFDTKETTVSAVGIGAIFSVFVLFITYTLYL